MNTEAAGMGANLLETARAAEDAATTRGGTPADAAGRAPVAADPPPRQPDTAVLSAEARELAQWRRRLLLPMLSLLGVLTVVFVAASLWQIADVQRRIAPPVAADVRLTRLDSMLSANPSSLGIASADLRARIALEDHAMSLRYQHAAAVLGSRAWVRFMAFLTGMVLALVGAGFTLGRLETTSTQMSGEGPGWKGALGTTSPGLVLAGMGTMLMLSAILVRVSVDVKDTATYLPGSLQVDGGDSTNTTGGAIREGARDLYDTGGLGKSGRGATETRRPPDPE